MSQSEKRPTQVLENVMVFWDIIYKFISQNTGFGINRFIVVPVLGTITNR